MKGRQVWMTLALAAAAMLAAAAVRAGEETPPATPGRLQIPQHEIWKTESFVVGMGDVGGAPLRRLQVRSGTTCYFWKNSVSCVRE